VQRKSGWESRDRIAYSPRITSFDLLPWHGLYDEWYVLEAPIDLGGIAVGSGGSASKSGRVDVFVNAAEFIFDPGNESMADEFWRQIERISPFAYVSEFDAWWLTVVCKDPALFAAIEHRFHTSVH